jgi:ATP-binding cassette, subfamily B, multidrug efflux pump
MSERNAQKPAGPGPRGPGGPGGPGGPMLGRPVEKAKDFRGTLMRLTEYLKPEKSSFMIVLFLSVASTVFSIVGPKIMGKAITKLADGVLARYAYFIQLYNAIEENMPLEVINELKRQAIPGFDFGYIGKILLLLVALYTISALCTYVMGYIMSSVSQNTVYRMRNDVKDKLDRLPLKYFDQRTYGEILSRVTNDMDNIATTLQQSLTQLITSIITVIGILIMMLTISPLMTLIAVVTLPASMLITVLVAKNSQKYYAEQQKCIGELNGHVEEMYGGHKIVKVFGHEEDSIEKFKGINDRLYGVGWKAQFMSGIIFPALNFVNNIGYVVICVVGGLMVAKKKIELGDIQAFIQYTRMFTQPIIQVANIANVLQSTVASAERVFEILNEEEQVPDRDDAKVIEFPQGRVRFEHVRFGYKEDAPLMDDLSIDVRAGSTIAIVGPTGAGKTTLVNLIMRFYEVQGGRITVDGVDIRDIKRGDLRMLFGMVLQDTWLFNGTIRENIAYGREGATEEEIINAATAANADHFIKTLPDGYDTILNEEASNISQGQKQLLTIARAILADPAILILDEATSNVDTRTEVLIQKAMANLMKDRTSFVIAHRLSTIRHADLILVMNQGAIIEQGSHNDLMAKGGFYAELYNSQFAGPAIA